MGDADLSRLPLGGARRLDTASGKWFTGRLQAAILGIDDPRLLAIFDRTKFITAKNDDYKVIEEVGRLTGLIN
jgi:phosphonate transport system substrate-binding protein